MFDRVHDRSIGKRYTRTNFQNLQCAVQEKRFKGGKRRMGKKTTLPCSGKEYHITNYLFSFLSLGQPTQQRAEVITTKK